MPEYSCHYRNSTTSKKEKNPPRSLQYSCLRVHDNTSSRMKTNVLRVCGRQSTVSASLTQPFFRPDATKEYLAVDKESIKLYRTLSRGRPCAREKLLPQSRNSPGHAKKPRISSANFPTRKTAMHLAGAGHPSGTSFEILALHSRTILWTTWARLPALRASGTRRQQLTAGATIRDVCRKIKEGKI